MLNCQSLMSTVRHSLPLALLTSVASISMPSFSDNVTQKLENTTRIFLVGDVMLGRGVDQTLRFHCQPKLYEDYVKDARQYTEFAIAQNGALPENRSTDYVWGDAIEILNKLRPDARIINLETAVTTFDKPWPNKGIHYRMHPGNVEVLQVAKIDCAVLANNHVLDWSYEGLTETLNTLKQAQIQPVGAGENLKQAQNAGKVSVPDSENHIWVFALGHSSSGVPLMWRASAQKSGVNYADIHNPKQIEELADQIRALKQPGDTVVLSIHWGSNWDFDLEPGHQDFARKLIDKAQVDIVHGHSSHHIKGVEIYNGKLIIYGAGDFLSDYEGIGSGHHNEFRDDLSFMYFADVCRDTGQLHQLILVPMRLRQLSVHCAEGREKEWLFETMKRESQRFGVANFAQEGGVLKILPNCTAL